MVVDIALQKAGLVEKSDEGVHGFLPLLRFAITAHKALRTAGIPARAFRLWRASPRYRQGGIRGGSGACLAQDDREVTVRVERATAALANGGIGPPICRSRLLSICSDSGPSHRPAAGMTKLHPPC
jgi:hypothetical protein